MLIADQELVTELLPMEEVIDVMRSALTMLVVLFFDTEHGLLRAVRPLRRVRVYSVPAESAARFAERESRLTGLTVEVADSAEQAVAGADLICTTTTAAAPVVLGAWISPGAHINAVGAYTPATRELDSELVAGARLYADRRESLLSESGEFLIAKGEGLIGDEHVVGEIGEVLTGKAPARTSRGEITLFKSLGIAIDPHPSQPATALEHRDML